MRKSEHRPLVRAFKMPCLTIALTLALSCNRADSAVEATKEFNALHEKLVEQGKSNPVVEANDVSWLFPPPKSAADVEKLISMDSMKSADGALSWSPPLFQRFLEIAASDKTKAAADARINFPEEVRSESAWKIVAFRVDPSAPGTSEEIIKEFGSAPQIRLIVQPVTVSNGTVKVHDISAHVIFTFRVKKEVLPLLHVPKVVPDTVEFQQIVDELVILKKLATDAGVPTSGPLGVHPGLASPEKVPTLLAELRKLLAKHLRSDRIDAMAMMGLPNGGAQPWIFTAIGQLPITNNFEAVPSPGLSEPTEFAEMLTFPKPAANQPPPPKVDHVVPAPRTNNRRSITSLLFVPPFERRGVSTKPLFEGADPAAQAVIGADLFGKPVLDPKAKNQDIPDIIANPDLAHFFNTDCVSCHTETTRRTIGKLTPGSFAFKTPAGIPALAAGVAPTTQWNLRNFGWVQSGTTIQATASQRTANETATVIDYINEHYLGHIK